MTGSPTRRAIDRQQWAGRLDHGRSRIAPSSPPTCPIPLPDSKLVLARPLGRALQACLDREPFTADVVVPVPLHRTRERKRGFNQTALLGAKLNRRLQLNLVRRRRNTDSQTGLTRSQRARNVQAAFECRRPIEGTVLLVDDVQTTGATINQVARVLRRSGASRIEVATLARAGVTGRVDPRS